MCYYYQHLLIPYKYINMRDFQYFKSSQNVNFRGYLLFSVLQRLYLFCTIIEVKSHGASLQGYFLHVTLGVSGHCAANYAAFSSSQGRTCWRWHDGKMMLHGWGLGGGPPAERRPSNGQPGKPNWQPSSQWGRGTPRREGCTCLYIPPLFLMCAITSYIDLLIVDQ